MGVFRFVFCAFLLGSSPGFTYSYHHRGSPSTLAAARSCSKRPSASFPAVCSWSRLEAAKKNRNKAANQRGSSGKKNNSKVVPRLIVFDLDGCLWRPELFELLACRDGAPFVENPGDDVPGTSLLSDRGRKIELLGDTRRVLHRLCTREEFYPSRIGISSRTDPPEWALELLERFSIYNDNESDEDIVSADGVSRMGDVFDRSLCILEKDVDKATQFRLLLERVNNSGGGGAASKKKNKKVQFRDVIFFDNEAGNCKQVAKLGVTCVYTPKGLTLEAWENGLLNFPTSRVVGPKLPY